MTKFGIVCTFYKTGSFLSLFITVVYLVSDIIQVIESMAKDIN